MDRFIKIEKNFRALIVFDDGSYIKAKTFDKAKSKIQTLELCFTTSLNGYQESISDPSYAGQALVFSFPHIGNTGINPEDFESCEIYTKAIILSEKPTLPSNHRSKKTFEEIMLEKDIICAFSVDTREMVQKIRSREIKNACFGVFNEGDNINISDMAHLAKNYTYDFQTLITPIISCKERKEKINKIIENSKNNPKNLKKAIVFDYGIKLNILNCLNDYGFIIEDVFPYNFDSKKIDFSKYDCIVFSNGPGDPLEAFELNKEIVEKSLESKLPILAICLGHQIIGMANPKFNMEAFKMKQGHRGINHPIKNIQTSKIEITSQNHGFALRARKEDSIKYVNLYSLFDGSIAGLLCEEDKIMTTQYHPESSCGAHDSRYIFKKFYDMV
jgi:carbamoyl-phosphate synthase small subunit